MSVQTLILAWLVSAFVGGFAHTGGRVIAATFLGVPPGRSIGLLYFSLLMFALGLIVQLIYGGLLYVFLSSYGALNLVIIILAYALPAIVLCWLASDRLKDFLMEMSWVLQALAMGVVSWAILSNS